MIDDLELEFGDAHRALERLYAYMWTPYGRRRLYAKLCGAETRSIVALAGRRVETVYSPTYT